MNSDLSIDTDVIDLRDCTLLLDEVVKHMESIAEDTGRPIAAASVGRLKRQGEVTLGVLKRALDARMGV